MIRLSIFAAALLAAAPAGAAPVQYPGYSPGHGAVLSALYPGVCGMDNPRCLIVCGQSGGPEVCTLSWDAEANGFAAPTPAYLDAQALPLAGQACARTIAERDRSAFDAIAGREQRDRCQWSPPIPSESYCTDLLDADRDLATARAAADAALAAAVAAGDLAAVTACAWQVEVAQ